LTQAETSALIETLQAQVSKLKSKEERDNLNPQDPVQDATSRMDEPNL
jgi:hypothetical protein